MYQGHLFTYSLTLSSQWSCKITVVKSILEKRKKTQSLGHLLRVMFVRGEPQVYTLLFWLQFVTISATSHWGSINEMTFTKISPYLEDTVWKGIPEGKDRKAEVVQHRYGMLGTWQVLQGLLENWEGVWLWRALNLYSLCFCTMLFYFLLFFRHALPSVRFVLFSRIKWRL